MVSRAELPRERVGSGGEASSRERFIAFAAGLAGLYEVVVLSGLPTVVGFFIPAVVHRAASLLFVLTLVYLGAGEGGAARRLVRPFDLLILLLGLAGAGYVAFFYESHVIRYSLYGYLDLTGQLLAVALGLALLEGVRRVAGWILPILIIALLLMTGFQSVLPGLLRGPSLGFDRIAYTFYVGASGIFGLPLGIATSIIIVYLIFGQLLQLAGAGRWFIDMAFALTGWLRGGPAKAAVVASAFFGMISGAPSANTATTGSFTIPLMKQVGYSPAFAAAVEATASTGGMILPPIMGAVAFIMADWLGIHYTDVIHAALIPAVLYYVILYASVHFQTLAKNIPMTPRQELPGILPAFLSGWHYVPPLAILIYFLVFARQDPEIAALYSLPFLIACSFLTRDRSHWLTPRRIWKGMVEGTRSWLAIAVLTASVGMLIGALELSGLGIKLSGFLVEVGSGSVILTLILVGIASLILGMGLDATPAYITLAILTAPALIQLGLLPMQAHLFVIYWGLASFLTPPVCLAVYVACSISGSGVWEAGFEAMRLGAASFLVSLAFALNPALLMQGSPGEIALATLTALVGAVLIASALQGYGLWRYSRGEQALVFVAGILLLGPGVWTAAAALALVAAVFAGRAMTKRWASGGCAVPQSAAERRISDVPAARSRGVSREENSLVSQQQDQPGP